MKGFWDLPILLLVSNLLYLVSGESQPQVPCYFIFGDSLSDSGNNNGRLTVEANFPPYGIDFSKGPTGRFSNGRLLVDVVAQLLGFDTFIPPYATAKGSKILKGVNYASSASGIRSETGKILGDIITLDMQLLNHRSIVQQIALLRGNNNDSLSTADYLGKCIYTVGIGTNDYIINYFFPLSETRGQFTPDQYARVLIDQYSEQLRTLYDSGARKVVLFGLGPLGSIPINLAKCASNSSCVANMNNAVQIFNSKLKPLVQDFNRKLTDAKFIYIDYYGIGSSYALSAGSLIINMSCCGGTAQSQLICIPYQIPCKERTRYVFWDGIHPTEATNVAIAARAYKSKFPTDAFPYDIHHLAQVF